MSISVSIIIPVYNLEKYIRKCLQSVLDQTFHNYEVIVINDGSQDKSQDIIEEFIETNHLSNFKLINKKNGGLSAARNDGMSQAEGKWITFIDGDDWIEPNYLFAMMEALEKHPSDLCYAGYRSYDESKNEYEVWSSFGDDSGVLPEDLDRLYSFGYCWAHFYKREIIEAHKLSFDTDIYCEDCAFNLDYNSVISSFCMTGEVVYNYLINREGALTQKVVHPNRKKRLFDHMQTFVQAYDSKQIISALEKNQRLSRVMWNELYATTTNLILDGKSKAAKARRKDPIIRTTLRIYKPRSKKEKLFKSCYCHCFFALKILVRIYYGNFEKMRKGKFLKFMSKTT